MNQIKHDYLTQFPPMRRAKIAAALNRQHRVNGVAEFRFQTAEKLAANPNLRIDLAKGRAYTSGDTFFELNTLTKSLIDYVQWLIDANEEIAANHTRDAAREHLTQ